MFYFYLACTCNPDGALDNFCDVNSGHCFCKEHIAGDQCDSCTEGYFGFPTCEGRNKDWIYHF